jgi:monofunctional biosynthetic peptidoglycan transglycosylase
MIAPGKYDLRGNDPALRERVSRIARLVQGQCAPLDHGDVWLEGCR